MHRWLDDAENASQVDGSDVSAADVVLYGLNIVVPLMTAELLKVLVYVCVLLYSISECFYTFIRHLV